MKLSLINLPQHFIFSPPPPLSSSSQLSNGTQLTLPRTQSQSLPSLTLSCSGVVRAKRRKPRKGEAWEEQKEDLDLEIDVLEYMKNSDKPNLFPTKEDLILGGRFDLVKRIVRQGGWLSYGWDLGDDEEPQMGVQEFDSRMFQDRTFQDSGNGSNSEDASSSGRMGGEEDSGIEGILTRLEKARNWSYGCHSKDEKDLKTVITDVPQSFHKDLLDDPGGNGMHAHSVHRNGNSSLVPRSSSKDIFDDPGGMHTHNALDSGPDVLSNHCKPHTWRNWINKRAGCSESEFEAAEFEEQFIQTNQAVANGTNKAGKVRTQLSIGDKIKEYKQIKSRLQNLEVELASVLSLLSCKKSDAVVSDKTSKNSSEELHSLYDALEFRETEIMKAQGKLRSLRAKVAVSEGKMALSVINAQKMVELKQKKVRCAQRALSLLRTASVTWHKSASEVLLVGSFDGWTSQRIMKKSSPGIFSLHLKLYPGRYEIKFIVDGVWMIDPLRPVVNSNGHQNNLLIVS